MVIKIKSNNIELIYSQVLNYKIIKRDVGKSKVSDIYISFKSVDNQMVITDLVNCSVTILFYEEMIKCLYWK